MLALTRRFNESVILHHPAIGLIRVMIMSRDNRGAVRIGIEAPKSVSIMREELLERVKIRNRHQDSKEVIHED